MERAFLYFLAKLAALIASVILLLSAKLDITVTVISTLSFACIFVLELLLAGRKNTILRLIISLCMVACFLLGVEQLLPLFVLLLIQLLDSLVDKRMFYYILSVLLLLIYFIFMPDLLPGMITLILTVMVLFGRILTAKLTYYITITEEQKEKLIGLNKKLIDIKSLAKTLKYNASVEERNRIAARIHDQVGHGISGSILMLEAALLILKDHPEKAEENIRRAITNLREGVDEIRTSLRDERVDPALVGITDIKSILEEFKVSYNKEINLKTSGNLDTISLEHWACIHDNLRECLTNLLKHSNATEFTLSIDVFKKVIKVEYRDNGYSEEGFERGLGLETIEERTVKAKGKCFFNKGEYGFVVSNIFMLQS